ncbi:MAG: hypothetical protein H3Z51_10665 [archaeon]|nr:hypothetical protein [archaeon]
MKVKFLIHIVRQNDQSWVAKCPAISKVSAACLSREEALKDIENQLIQYLQTEGQSYLSAFKGTGDVINCPEGYIELPIDVWKCKLDDKTCSLQAQVLITEEAKFLSECRAPEGRKQAIFRAIKDGKYNGFHHIPGRYLCPLCKGKIHRRYHYPWELTLLSKFFNVTEIEQWLILRKRLVKKNIDIEAGYIALCPKCFKNVVSKIDPKAGEQLEILELNFFDKPS